MNELYYQQAIEQLILEGYSILQITPSNGLTLFFIVYKWQEGYFNTAQSVDFNTVTGINITEFITKNSAHANNRTNFISLLNKTIENSIVIRCEFSKESIWYKWSSDK